MEINFASKKKSSKSKTPAKVIENSILKRLPADALSDDVQVMVTEVSCTEPDCVPLETLVICIGMQARWADKVLKPIAEVTESDLEELDIPSNWTEWIQSEKERKALKNATGVIRSDDNGGGKQITDPTPSTVYPPPPPVSSTSAVAVAVAAPTLVTMRPRTEQTQSKSSSDWAVRPSQATPPSTSTTSPPPSVHVAPTFSTTSSQQAKTQQMQPLTLKSKEDELPSARHSRKGVRQRGCPCCDPDNMDNILDRMLYFDAPP